MLFYAKSQKGSESSKSSREWRLCVRSEEEKKRILQSCHESKTGMYNHYDMYLQLPVVLYFFMQGDI